MAQRKISPKEWASPTIFILWELMKDSTGIRRLKKLMGATLSRKGAIRWANRYTQRSHEEIPLWRWSDIQAGSPGEQWHARQIHWRADQKRKANGD